MSKFDGLIRMHEIGADFDEEQPSLSVVGQSLALCQMLSRVESEEVLFSSLDDILEKIATSFEFDAVALVMRKPHQPAFMSFLHDVHSFGLNAEEKKKLSFFLAQSIAPEVVQRTRCIRREDVRKEILGDQAIGNRTKMVSMLAVPMLYSSEVIGIVVAFRAEVAAFCIDDEHLFRRVAAFLAEDIENACAYLRFARDPLTGFHSRRVFFEALFQETTRARRYQAPLSAMMLDFDALMPIAPETKKNSDQLLKRFSQRIMSETRQSDIVARVSDAAFLFLQPMTSMKSSTEVAIRIRTHFEHNPIVINEITVPIGISIGISSLRPSDEDGTAMLMRADRATSAARKKGINQIAVFHEQGENN